MSDVYHGVIVNTDEQTARNQFSLLRTDYCLRLTSLGNDVFGYSVPRQGGAFKELQRIASQLSGATDVAVIYFYDSCVGFVFEVYENCKLTRSQNFDENIEIDPFDTLGVSEIPDDNLEAAFRWGSPQPLMTNTPEWESAKLHFPVGRHVTGVVIKHLVNSGVLVDLNDEYARGWVSFLNFADECQKATSLFPPIGNVIEAIVLCHGDEQNKLIHLRLDSGEQESQNICKSL